jgi:hypothetical protein
MRLSEPLRIELNPDAIYIKMEQAVWRPRIKRAAWGAILLSLVSFWYGYSSGSYISVLIGTFLFVLGVSHLIYAGWEQFPKLAVRLVDYVYVGCGTVAALFAIQGQHEREIYLRALSQAMTNVHAMSLPVSPTPDNLEKYIAGEIETYCINKSQIRILQRRSFSYYEMSAKDRRIRTKDLCAWVKHLRGLLANKFSMSDLSMSSS